MMQSPWDRAQPDEWLPRSLRLCWGSSSGGGGGGDGGGGWGGDSGYGGGWGGDSGYGGATTGGGDWGSSGSYDASSFNAATNDAYGAALAASPGGFYDTGGAGIAQGALGAEFGGSFGTTGISGQPGTNAFGAELDAGGGGTSGVGHAIASWGQSTVAGPPGAGTFADLSGIPGGAPSYFGGWGDGFGGGAYGGGGYGGGGFTGGGGKSGSGGGYTGGGGGGGKSGGVTNSTPGYVGTASGGKDVTQSSPSNAPTKGEAQIESAGPDVNTGRADADPEAAPGAAPAPDADPDAAPLGSPAPSQSDQPAPTPAASRPSETAPTQTEAAPTQTETSTPTTSNFGPQSLNTTTPDYQGAPYTSNYDQGPQQAAPQASFDSRFGDWSTAPSSQAYQDAAQQLSNLTQTALEPAPADYQGSPYANMGPDGQQTAPDFNQAFQAFEAQPGWNPAEQTAGRAGLAEPTDWAANPYETQGALGRDFDQAFQPFAYTPTGMDLAGDLATPQGDINPNSTFQSGWAPDNANEGRGEDDAAGRAAQDYVTTLVSAAPAFVAAPAVLSAISAITGISVPGLLGGAATTGGILSLMGLDPGARPAPPQEQVTNVEIVPAISDQSTPLTVDPSTTGALQQPTPPQEAAPAAPTETAPTAPTAPTEAAPPVAPSETAPVAPPEAAPAAPPEAQPQAPPEAQPQAPPPSLVEMVSSGAQTPQVQPTETPQVQPGLVNMLPPAFTPAPQVRPAETPAVPPQEQPAEPDQPGDHNAPEPGDRSQPPEDPNAPRPPANIPGQLRGSRGQYDNNHADTPQTSRTYSNSGRTDYPQGRPGITFRTARQAGIQPLFRTEDINTEDTDARLVENINRALRDMEQRTGIPANSLVATSGWRAAHRGEALEHGMDARTSQESVYSRGHPTRGRGFPSAPPGHSNHGPGRALDFAASRARAWLRQHAREYGLETLGGTFDMPHIQLQRGQGGARPSAQEQAEQRAIDEQNRQAAIDRGLIAPGRGQAPAQQAGVPTPRARPSDAPQAQPDVAQPRPPADIPPPAQPPTEIPTALPPQVPQETRPPADIPAPTLTPPRAGRADPALMARTASQIAADMAAKGPRPTSLAEGTAAAVALARSLAQAGIPANIANQIVTNVVREGTRQAGYDPDGMLAGSAVKGVIATALQGYRPAAPGAVQGPPAPEASLRGLAKGGHVAKDEPVVVGEEGPEYFVPDQPGTVVPHMPQPGKTGKTENIDRWPKLPAPNYPGRYGGVEREMLRQTRSAQDPMPGLMDMIDSGRMPLNEANWNRMINDPGLIALGRSRMDDRREGIDPGAEQYGAFMPAPEPAAEPPDPNSPMAQALGYGSIKRRPVRVGRQSY